MRWIFLPIGIAGLVAMLSPSFEKSGTEIGFQPGSPDPNTYQSAALLGQPWNWIEWGTSRNEINNPVESRILRFHLVPFLGYVVVVVVSFFIFLRLRNSPPSN